MKIGIVTIISHNLGNRLQNYALQEILKTYGTVETFPLERTSNMKCTLKILAKKMLNVCGIKKNYSWDMMDRKVKWSKYICGKNDVQIEKKYDYLVAGSDQIWNPLFDFNSDREFLVSVNKNKRIAYAASIGIDQLPENQKRRFRDNLLNFKAISVRENAAADIVEEITGKRPEVVIDPTMLLKQEEWEKMSKESDMDIQEKYIVKYFLGVESKEYSEYIDELANKLEAKIININSENKGISTECGPSDFLKLISKASFVCTDSFHGSVFSILFKRQFLIFDRPKQKGYGKMSSRIDTLVGKFNLEKRVIKNIEQLNGTIERINYDKLEPLIETERNKAHLYLDRLFL